MNERTVLYVGEAASDFVLKDQDKLEVRGSPSSRSMRSRSSRTSKRSSMS